MTETLAERVRRRIGDDPDVVEIRMFGGRCFMLTGNMLVCTTKDDALLVRVGEAGLAAALERPGAARMEMGGREMKGFVVVQPDRLDAAALRAWIATARAFVGAMPPKARKPAKPSQSRAGVIRSSRRKPGPRSQP